MDTQQREDEGAYRWIPQAPGDFSEDSTVNEMIYEWVWTEACEEIFDPHFFDQNLDVSTMLDRQFVGPYELNSQQVEEARRVFGRLANRLRSVANNFDDLAKRFTA